MSLRVDKAKELRLLTPMRGIAALMIVAYHFVPLLPNLTGGKKWVWHMTSHGYLWVDFFFILSGFVLTHVYRDMRMTGSNIARFIGRRFGRIYPFVIMYLIQATGFKTMRGWTPKKTIGQVVALPAGFCASGQIREGIRCFLNTAKKTEKNGKEPGCTTQMPI